ncbi:MAG: VOC family protein [Gammaproteobacteria bacterium]|nr:VOC family protein [Gammaproteobacteria bacterium]
MSEINAKIFRILIPVSDIEQAAGFYGAVLSQAGQRISPGRHYFNCGGLVLACFDPVADGDGYDPEPLPEPIYFAVDDLQTVFDRAASAGATFPDDEIPNVGYLGKIQKRPWGEVSFYASDPFGNPLCFVSSESVFTGDVGAA